MSDSLATISHFLPYLAPPVIGAFIGYLTNRVAIRMLFRPLKKWKIGPVPVPMTPGVIPSKRHALAVNIGEMVGEHLLTSEEIAKALRKKEFQEHLYQLIESRIGTLTKQDLGPLPSIIPQKYGSYFEIASKTVLYRVKESVNDYLDSEKFARIIMETSDSMFSALLEMTVEELLPYDQRSTAISIFEAQIKEFINSESFEITVKKGVASKVSELVNSGDSMRGILPAQINDMIIEMVANQAPSIAESASGLVGNPDIIDRITSVVRKVIEEFIESLGPMAAMVNNFLDIKKVEEKIVEYLERDDNDFRKIFEDERVIHEIKKVLREKATNLLDKPLEDVLKDYHPDEISRGCDQISEKLIESIRNRDGTNKIKAAIEEFLEQKVSGGNRTVGSVLSELADDSRREGIKIWLSSRILSALRSKPAKDGIHQIIDQMAYRLLEKPIGKLSNFIPAGVRNGIYGSIQQVATRMLIAEVPGIVKSLNIRKIVTERIDSFDLLRLEKLLLSIMEEQFKYINLFGGLLGFLIGCANLLVVFGSR